MKEINAKYALLFALALAVTFTGCKDDDDDEDNTPAPVLTNTQKLTGNNWVLVSIVTNDPDYDYCEAIGNGFFEVFGCAGYLEDCELDDFSDYNLDMTYTYEPGAVLCPNEAQEPFLEGTWAFNGDETMILTSGGLPGGGSFSGSETIQSLSASELVTIYEYEYLGTTYTEVLTYR